MPHKELLSSGGNASGPVRFLRGADASAGTIKSGGATRRAAKMVILDVDHADIDTKVKEEEKIRTLRDAGFDRDLGGARAPGTGYAKDVPSTAPARANGHRILLKASGGAADLRRVDPALLHPADRLVLNGVDPRGMMIYCME